MPAPKVFMALTDVPAALLPAGPDRSQEDRLAWVCAIASTRAVAGVLLANHGYRAPSALRRITRELRQVPLPVVPDHNSVASPHRSHITELLDSGAINTSTPGIYVWESSADGAAVDQLQPGRVIARVATFRHAEQGVTVEPVAPSTESEPS